MFRINIYQIKNLFLMARNTLTGLFLAALLLISATSYTVETDIAKTNVVVVTGNSQVTIKPDIAILYAYLTADGKTATDATANAEAIVDNVIRNLQGIATKDDIGTSYIQVYPKYDYSSGSPVIVGYTVYQSLIITIRNVSNNNNRISRAIDAIASAGVASISGITYSVQDEEKGKSEARRLAYEEASREAAEYARLSKRKLGKILKIDESTPAYYLPLSQSLTSAPAPGATLSIPLADLVARVAVVIVYQLI